MTVTHSRTPLIASPDTPFDRGAARDYVQIGVIEVNRMGAREYFLWLGISIMTRKVDVQKPASGFETITLTAGGNELQFDVHGWTHEAIGLSEPVYRKYFGTTVDAYFRTTVEQIRMLAEADEISFRTSSAQEKFVLWYESATAREDLAEFYRTVSR